MGWAGPLQAMRCSVHHGAANCLPSRNVQNSLQVVGDRVAVRDAVQPPDLGRASLAGAGASSPIGRV